MKTTKTAPKEITQERFHEMLEVLPPIGWASKDGNTSFKISETWNGILTSIYAFVDGKYWEMIDNINTPHDAIVKAVKGA